MNAPEHATCDICHRKFREEPRWRTRLRGGPRQRCTDRRNCWNAYLSRSGLTASMPTVPAYLQRRTKALYLANLDDLREATWSAPGLRAARCLTRN